MEGRTPRQAYLLREETRRMVLTGTTTLLAIVGLVGGAWLWDLYRPQDWDQSPGPVRVRIASVPAGNPQEALVPEAPVAETPPPLPEVAPAETPPEPAAPPVVETPAPSPAPAQTSTPARPANPARPASPPPPTPETSKAVEQVIRGGEAGNSWEMTIGTTEELAGPTGGMFYVDSMPLPNTVTSVIGEKAGQSFYGTFFDKYYVETSTGYSLTRTVSVIDRPAVWAALRDGGYDQARAEYKLKRPLQTIVLEFKVSPGPNPTAVIIKTRSSSGDFEVDQALIYAFLSQNFSNKTNREITGTFTYRF